MRRTSTRLTIIAVAAAAAAASTPVNALTLGDIDVTSSLNQRFTATIPLVEISAEDLETVTISVASGDAYERAGIERPDYLSSLSFDIADNKGRPKVIISSGQIVREPVLNLLLQARWKGGKIVRDYVVLLDPPVASGTKPAASKPAVVAVPLRNPASAPPAAVPTPTPAPLPVPPPVIKPAAPATPTAEFFETGAEKPASPGQPAKTVPPVHSEDGFFDGATTRYGPVAPQQTLWNIATQVRPSPAVSLDQVMLALALANPEAIQRGTTVEKGATLRVPDAAAMQAVSPAQARARLAELRAGRSSVPVGTAKSAAEKPAASPAVAAVEKPAGAAAVKAESAKPETAAATPQSKATKADAASSAVPVVPAAGVDKPVANAVPPAAPTAAASPAPASAPAPANAVPAVTPAPIPSGAPASPAVAAPVVSEPQTQGCNDWLLLLAAAGVALLAVIAGLLFLRRRKRSPAAPSASSRAPAPPAVPAVAPPVSATRSDPMLTLAVEPGNVPVATIAANPPPLAPASPAASAAVAATPADDPIAEADFHLAYGLYDDAIQLLQQAELRNPGRQDIAVKLAEAFFAAGRADQFEHTAQTLHGRLPEAEWAKLALMGRQLCPQSALFQPAAGESFEADFDLGFDDPVPETTSQAEPHRDENSQRLDLPSITPLAFDVSQSAKFSESAHSPTAQFENLLDSLPPALPPGPSSLHGSPAPNLHLDDPHSIDFMLGQSLTPLGAAAMSGQSSGSTAHNSGGVDFKLDRVMDFSGTVPVNPNLDVEPLLAISREPAVSSTASDSFSISLQDLEVSMTPRELSGVSVEAEVNTKLDLARAYVEMGDDEMAQSLLEEVRSVGSEQQKQEAVVLLQRLGKA